MQQEIGQLFNTGKDREASEILVDHIMLVSPGADHQKMLQTRNFAQGKLVTWNLSVCKISKLPHSFGALVCSGALSLNGNELESLPEGFSDITLGRDLILWWDPSGVLQGNPRLTGIPKTFPNVRGRVIR